MQHESQHEAGEDDEVPETIQERTQRTPDRYGPLRINHHERNHIMGIKIDTDYTGNPDHYVREHIANDAEKLVDISRLLTRPATTITVYNLRSEEHTSELQSRGHLVCRLLLEKKNKTARSLLV